MLLATMQLSKALSAKSLTNDRTSSGKSFMSHKRAKGRGLYPGVRQKSLDIDLMSGFHKQLIENVV